MKKPTLIILILSLIILSACQSVGTKIPRNSAEEDRNEKATQNSTVNIVVSGEPQEESTPALE